jgi:hypothetical protein
MGPCVVLVALLELLGGGVLVLLEAESVGEGDEVMESVALGVGVSVAGAVLSWANPSAASPRKRTSDRRMLGRMSEIDGGGCRGMALECVKNRRRK